MIPDRIDVGPESPARPDLIPAVLLFLVLVAVEWACSAYAPRAFPEGVTGALLLTGSVRVLDLILVILFLKVTRTSRRHIGLGTEERSSGIRRGLLWASGLGVCAVIGLASVRIAAGQFPDLFPRTSLLFRIPWPGALYILVGVIVGPVVEETVFRGVLYNGLRTICSAPGALALTVLPFSLAHGMAPQSFFPAFVGGVLFTVSFERSRSLWTPAILHVLGNGGLWLYGFLRSPFFPV